MSCVVDASALLALILGERGGADIRDVLEGASMSAVNYHEVLVRLCDREAEHGVKDTIRRGVNEVSLRLRLAPFDEQAARVAAELRDKTRHLGLSLGDRACLALGLSAALPVLTADRRMAESDIGLDIRLIR